MKWELDEIDFMSVALEKGWTHKEIGNELKRTSISVSHQANRFKLYSTNYNKTHAKYITQVPTDILVLELYLGANIKILHKHSCGFEWKVPPRTILSGHGCPMCNSSFNSSISGTTYLIYFSDYDIYKFGISNKPSIRFKHFGSIPEIILLREFTLGSEARELEKK